MYGLPPEEAIDRYYSEHGDEQSGYHAYLDSLVIPPDKIKQRILDARAGLPEPYRKVLYHGTFLPDQAIWLSKDRRYGLQWVRLPEVWVRDVNIGSVKLLFTEQIKELLGE